MNLSSSWRTWHCLMLGTSHCQATGVHTIEPDGGSWCLHHRTTTTDMWKEYSWHCHLNSYFRSGEDREGVLWTTHKGQFLDFNVLTSAQGHLKDKSHIHSNSTPSCHQITNKKPAHSSRHNTINSTTKSKWSFHTWCHFNVKILPST